jgi:hypothetical protein
MNAIVWAAAGPPITDACITSRIRAQVSIPAWFSIAQNPTAE